MVATSAHHIVRVTVRINAAAIHRDIDVTLPTSSTLAEILPELARLIELPEIDRPWAATTVAGEPLDMYTPLHKLTLFDGSVVTLSPEEPPEPPVIRDAAESLSATARGVHDPRGLDVAASVAGVLGICFLMSVFVPWSAALLIGALVLATVAIAAKSLWAFWLVPPAVAAAAFAWVAGPRDQWASATDPALGVLAGATAAAVAIAAGLAFQLTGRTAGAFHLTCSALAALGALGAWLPAPLAPAALVVLAGVLAVMATPGVATRAAGLQIPRVPTAGEEFANSDGYQLDVDARSAAAVKIADAMAAAIAVCTIPALGFAAWHGGEWVSAFCLATAGALVLHASRHHYPAARIALTLTALAALIGSAVALARTANAHPALVVLCLLIMVGAACAMLWARRIPELEPTTVVWFERAEAAAIIAVIPLSVALTGLFSLIRAL